MSNRAFLTRKPSISLVLLLALLGCLPKRGDTGTLSASPAAAFLPEITGKRACPNFTPDLGPDDMETGFISSGDQPTKVYHWTEDPFAAENPQKYVEKVIVNGIKANDAGTSGGWVGAGLYVAADPLQSAAWGSTVVELEIKPKTKYVRVYREHQGRDAYKKGCPAVVYTWRNYYSVKPTFSDHDDGNERAIVIWDLGDVVPGSIKSWSMRSGGESTGNPPLDKALRKIPVHTDKYVTNMWALKDPMAGKPLDLPDDLLPFALGERIVSCLPPPYSQTTYPVAHDLGTAFAYDTIHAETNDDTTPLGTQFIQGRNSCLAKHGLAPASGSSRKAFGLAAAKLKLTDEQLAAWVKNEVAVWKPIVAHEKARHTLSDWTESK